MTKSDWREKCTKESVWIVVPAYNEEATIRQVIFGLRRFWPNVVVVDDCSIDSTAPRARGAGARVVEHPINLGQGAALQTGLIFTPKRR